MAYSAAATASSQNTKQARNAVAETPWNPKIQFRDVVQREVRENTKQLAEGGCRWPNRFPGVNSSLVATKTSKSVAVLRMLPEIDFE